MTLILSQIGTRSHLAFRQRELCFSSLPLTIGRRYACAALVTCELCYAMNAWHEFMAWAEV
jgi:hypothetical protein